MSAKPTVLVIDDKANMLALLSKVLGKIARVVTANGVRRGVEVLERERVAVVVCDLKMPDGDGLDVLRAVRGRWPGTPFILLTAYATVPTAVQAMREGAFDYVTKPFEAHDLRSLVSRALAESKVLAHEPDVTARDALGTLVGRSPAMRDVFQLVERLAPTDATVLFVGESGTGKEMLARALHELSSRSPRRFVTLACAAVSRGQVESELFGHVRGAFTGATADRAGLLEDATGGTLFVDDVSELRPAVQAKLARALEERAARRIGETRDRRVDVRLVAATSWDLRALVKAGAFREQLWFRLNVGVVKVPPLRDRAGDVALLARRFLAEAAPRTGSKATSFTPEALAALESYTWPGNVRELRSAVERASITESGAAIALESLPPEVRGAGPLLLTTASDVDLASLSYREALDASREETNRRYLEALMRRFRGDVVGAAAHAGVERESFYRLMRRCGLSADEFRDDAPAVKN